MGLGYSGLVGSGLWGLDVWGCVFWGMRCMSILGFRSLRYPLLSTQTAQGSNRDHRRRNIRNHLFSVLHLGQNMSCKVEPDGGLGVGRAFLQASRVSGVAGSFMGPAPVVEML